jgi:hypothetical protein
MKMMKLADIKARLRAGKYAWPGGYPCYFVTTDGAALSFEAVRDNWLLICEAHIVPGYCHSGWAIEGCDINWEDPDLICDHTGQRIESAYAEK